MPERYRSYPCYKASGAKWIGEIPDTWSVFDGKRLFNNCRTKSLANDEQLAASQKYGVIPQSLMMDLNDSKVMLALTGTDSFKRVNKDNYVISLRSFEGGIEHSEYEGCVSPAYTVLVPSKRIFPRYFKYVFKCRLYISALQSITDSLREGKSITYEQFGRIPLVYPELDEQKSIAGFLDHEIGKIDNLIEKQQQLIKLLKEKRQAVISHAVTKGLNPDAPMKDSGVEWLGEMPEHWDVSKMRYITDELTVGIVVTPAKYYVDEGVPCFRSLNVRENSLNESDFVYISARNNEDLSKSKVFAEDIIVVRTGQPGTAAVVERRYHGANCIDLIILRKSKKFSSRYLCYQINSDVCKRQVISGSGGAIQQHFNVETAKGLCVAIPPIEEQKRIADYIGQQCLKYDVLIGNAVRFVQLSEERRTALISAAITGKIDVRGWQPAQTEIPMEACA